MNKCAVSWVCTMWKSCCSTWEMMTVRQDLSITFKQADTNMRSTSLVMHADIHTPSEQATLGSVSWHLCGGACAQHMDRLQQTFWLEEEARRSTWRTLSIVNCGATPATVSSTSMPDALPSAEPASSTALMARATSTAAMRSTSSSGAGQRSGGARHTNPRRGAAHIQATRSGYSYKTMRHVGRQP
jgi:hypothetical protein